MSEGAIQLSQLGPRQGGDKVAELTLEHQGEKITADRGGPWQALFGPQHNLSGKSEDFSVHRSADHRRHIVVLGHEGSGHDDVESRFGATLRDTFPRTVYFASPHGRACSAMRTRAWRARRVRCFRNTSPSLASISRRRARSANSCSAVRTIAERFRSGGEASVNSSRSFNVASSTVTAIVFILGIISPSAPIYSRREGVSPPSSTTGKPARSRRFNPLSSGAPS